MPDPLDVVTEMGYRVIWVHQLGAGLLLLEKHLLALADADLTRVEVAEKLLGALPPTP